VEGLPVASLDAWGGSEVDWAQDNWEGDAKRTKKARTVVAAIEGIMAAFISYSSEERVI
jgi:hypothetical protein